MDKIAAIFDRINSGFITSDAKIFAIAMLRENMRCLREIENE